MKMRCAILVWLIALPLFCQAPAAESSEAEDKALRQALSEAGSSPVEFARAIERHLERFPTSPKRAELERALVKAAIDARDDERILKYGDRALEAQPGDPLLLERYTRALLNTEDQESSRKALKLAKNLETVLRSMSLPESSSHMGKLSEEVERAVGRSQSFQARATGNLGNFEEAVALARKSYTLSPTAESARELGRWLARSGQEMEAVRAYADAFTIPDPRNTDADRAKDRRKMGELYTKAKGNETGLGDLILQAYDRTAEQSQKALNRQRVTNPNAKRSDAMEFTLKDSEGGSLKMSDLRGKVVVLDFWATWCGPCRVQHPLYEEVKKRFVSDSGVRFLSINTDEDQSAVKPFLQGNKWGNVAYFDSGLADLFKVNSIPTTIILNREGKIVSRMIGFLPERFVEMLSERIREAL